MSPEEIRLECLRLVVAFHNDKACLGTLMDTYRMFEGFVLGESDAEISRAVSEREYPKRAFPFPYG